MSTQEYKADLLIITVTNIEAETVINAFKECNGTKANSIQLSSGRAYRNLDKIDSRKVFMTRSRQGSSGDKGSQKAVEEAILDLKPKDVIMVGIAFGMNKEKQTIGDVLVATQLKDIRQEKKGRNKNISRGSKVPCHSRLLDNFKITSNDWKIAKVHEGLMLSGEKLLDNKKELKKLKKTEPEAIGGEMEGNGLYESCQMAKIDWILIKGISDWGDGTKDDKEKDENQKKAAKNAIDFVLYALKNNPLESSEDAATAEISQQSTSRNITAEAYIENVEGDLHIHNNDIPDQSKRTLLKFSLVTAATVATAGSVNIALLNKEPESPSTIKSFKDIVSGIRHLFFNDYTKFISIESLKDWSKTKKKITIEVAGKEDIYRGLIFPIFKCKDIIEIKFSSTSVLWGHQTFGGNIISNEFLDIVGKTPLNKKSITMISSTPNIIKLYEDYGNTFQSVLNENDNIFNTKDTYGAVFSKQFHIKEYYMLLRTGNLSESEYYYITFLNERKSGEFKHIVQFSGQIQVQKLSYSQYLRSVKTFDKTYSESVRYKDAIDSV